MAAGVPGPNLAPAPGHVGVGCAPAAGTATTHRKFGLLLILIVLAVLELAENEELLLLLPPVAQSQGRRECCSGQLSKLERGRGVLKHHSTECQSITGNAPSQSLASFRDMLVHPFCSLGH